MGVFKDIVGSSDVVVGFSNNLIATSELNFGIYDYHIFSNVGLSNLNLNFSELSLSFDDLRNRFSNLNLGFPDDA